MKINNLNILWLFLICSTILTCNNPSNEDEKPFTRKDITNNFALKGKQIYFEEIYFPSHITQTKDFIVVKDRKTDPELNLINKQTLQFVRQKGKQGMGPKEIGPIFSFLHSDNDQQIIGKSLSQGRVGFFDANSSQMEADSIVEYSKYTNESILFEIESDSTLIGVSSYLPEKFIRINLNQRKVTKSWETWEMMLDDPREIPLHVYSSIFQGSFRTNKHRKRFGYSTLYMDLIEILDTQTDKILSIRGPDNIKHEFEVDYSAGYGMHYIPMDKMTFGYVDFQFGENLIYALYANQQSRPMGNEIIVFDFEGNPICAFQLDIPLQYLIVDEVNEKIYGLNNFDQEPCIVEYKYDKNAIQ
ncbi:BF3164 family lipoprotein [Peijinzhouia sedimentorum]